MCVCVSVCLSAVHGASQNRPLPRCFPATIWRLQKGNGGATRGPVRKSQPISLHVRLSLRLNAAADSILWTSFFRLCDYTLCFSPMATVLQPAHCWLPLRSNASLIDRQPSSHVPPYWPVHLCGLDSLLRARSRIALTRLAPTRLSPGVFRIAATGCRPGRQGSVRGNATLSYMCNG